jgi:hypothetical protein
MRSRAGARDIPCVLGGALVCGAWCLFAFAPSYAPPWQNVPRVASLSLTCTPAVRGVRCRLLAIFQDVSRSSQDITSEAVWLLSGVPGARISPMGVVDAPIHGDVTIEGLFGGRRARTQARLVGNGSGELLTAVHGRVYSETAEGLRTVARARVEVLDGQTAAISTMTREDGTYELTGLVPGEVTIRVTSIGFASAERSSVVLLGENCLSMLIEPLPPTVLSLM